VLFKQSVKYAISTAHSDWQEDDETPSFSEVKLTTAVIELIYLAGFLLIETQREDMVLDPGSVVVGAAIVPLLWAGSKVFGSLRNHTHRDKGVRGLKVREAL